jgi:hypothetical protein
LIRIRINSDKELREESKDKLKNIFENSKDLQKDLSDAFPNGFTKFSISRFTLTLGRGMNLVSFIDINGFQNGVLEKYHYGTIVNTRDVIDY